MNSSVVQLPIMSVSGIRGIVGQSLTPSLLAVIAFIQTKLTGGGTILVGRDSRPSGTNLSKAIFAGIRAAGGVAVDLGICPTPTVCVAVKHFNASSGIIITASHNPSQYNGYKMVHKSGRLFNEKECNEVYEAFRKGDYPDELIKAVPSAPSDSHLDAISVHIDKIIAAIDVKTITEANLCIAVDAINGAAGTIFPLLLRKLGVRYEGVYTSVDGNFAHNPEPRPEHLTALAGVLQQKGNLHGGFAFDPDADRLALMGVNGEPITEEMTLALALTNVLNKKRTDVATNLSTSMVIDDIADHFGVRVHRTKIGEANVVEAIVKYNCAIGGEGNGGVIYPEISTVRDGCAAMALLLELMASKNKNISQLVGQWPKYYIVKDKIEIGDVDVASTMEKLVKRYSAEKVDTTDGLKILRNRSWVHIRPSNTEPILRCIAEASTEAEARGLLEEIKKGCLLVN